MSRTHYTVFISYAGEDREALAFLLYQQLRLYGIRVFLAHSEIRTGEDTSRAILNAMETVSIAIIILSPDFIAKDWPLSELDFLLRRAESLPASTIHHPAELVLVPVFYRLSVAECHQPTVFEKYRDVFAKHGFMDGVVNPEAKKQAVLDALDRLSSRNGITNALQVTNDMTAEMEQSRNGFINRIVQKVVHIFNDLVTARSVNSTASSMSIG